MTLHLTPLLSRLSPPVTTPRPKAAPLDLERLDDRLTPSAAAGVSGGVLYITGDAGDNDITFNRLVHKGSVFGAVAVDVVEHGRALGRFELDGVTGFRFDGGGGDDTVGGTGPWLPRITGTTAAVEGGVLFVRGDANDNSAWLQPTFTKGVPSRVHGLDVYEGYYRVASFPPAVVAGLTGVRFDGGPGIDAFYGGNAGLARLTSSTVEVRGGVLFVNGDADNNDITFHRALTKGKVEVLRVLDFQHVLGEFPLAGLSGFRYESGGGEDTVAAIPRLPRIYGTTAAVERGALSIRGDAANNHVRLERTPTKSGEGQGLAVYEGNYRVASFPAAALQGVTGVRFDGGPGIDSLALGDSGLPRLTRAAAEVRGGVLFVTGDDGDNEVVLQRTITKGTRVESVRVLDFGRVLGVFPLAGLSGFRFDGGGGDDTVGGTGPWLPRVTGTTAAVEGGVLFIRGDANDNNVTLRASRLRKNSLEYDLTVYDGDYRIATFPGVTVAGLTGVRFEGGAGTDTLDNPTRLPRLTGTTAEVRWPNADSPSLPAPPVSSLVAASQPASIDVSAQAPALRLVEAEAAAGVAFDFHGARLADAPPERRVSWQTPGLAELEVDY